MYQGNNIRSQFYCERQGSHPDRQPALCLHVTHSSFGRIAKNSEEKTVTTLDSAHVALVLLLAML